MTATPPRRIPALDGLRGIAILMVLFFHATVVGSGTPAEALLHGTLRNFGWAGVDLFFVLSGFLITGLLVDAQGSSRALRSFYARRALRIFPVYYGFLALAFVFGSRFLGDAFQPGDDGLWYWLYLQNFATAAAGDWTHGRTLNLFWSLAIEEQFYLLWPWVVLRCEGRTLRRICLGAIGGSFLLRVALVSCDTSPVAVYVLTPARLDALAAGAWVASAARESGGVDALRPAAGRLLAVCALLAGCGAVLQGGGSYQLPGTATVGLLLCALGFASLLVLALASPPDRPLRRLLEGRGLALFGRTSYALYVVHQVVLVLATRWLADHVFEPYWPEASLLTYQLTLYAVTLAGSLALAQASWIVLERPLLALKRHFPYAERPA